jgi:hypothetical protein
MRNASWPYYDKGTLVGGRSGPRPDKAEIIKLGPAEVLTKLRHVSAVLLGMRGSKCMFLVKSCLRIVSDDVGSALVIGHLQRRSSRPKSAITRSAQRPSVHLSSFKPRQLRRPKEKLPEGCEAWSFQSTPADCRAWKVSSIRKSGLSRSFLAFMGKNATHHRRPYTSRTPGRSTPNAGRNRKHQRSVPRSRRLLEHRGTRRCRRASHRHRGLRRAPRRKPGLQLLTRVTGPSPVQYQVSTLRFSIRT